MENNVSEFIDHSRWLMNNGIFNDVIKNNLYMYGSLVHRDVKAVNLQISAVENKLIYTVYLSKKALEDVKSFEDLKDATSIWGLFKLRRLLKKHGNLNLKGILSKFVKDYCGPKWNVELILKDFSTYVEQKSEDNQGH